MADLRFAIRYLRKSPGRGGQQPEQYSGEDTPACDGQRWARQFAAMRFGGTLLDLITSRPGSRSS